MDYDPLHHEDPFPEWIYKSNKDSEFNIEDFTADIRNKLTPALTLAEITDDINMSELCNQVKLGVDHIVSKLSELDDRYKN